VSEIASFFHMGGYAVYVWPSFLISFLVLLANVLVSRAQFKRTLRETAVRAKARAESQSSANNN